MKNNCTGSLFSFFFFFSKYIYRTEGRSFWVGLNRRDPEHPGGWEWSDGTPVSAEITAGLVVSGNIQRATCRLQVVTTFVEDNAEDDDRRHCAVYSYLTNALVPQLCDAKREWICKITKGKPCGSDIELF